MRHRPPEQADPTGWRLWLPEGVQAGVHAETPGDPSGLLHAGENWAAPDYEIGEHTHPGWELYLQLHGGSTWLVDGRRMRLAAGWLVAVPPGVAHHGLPRGTRHQYAYAAFDLPVVARRRPELAAAWPAGGILSSARSRHLAPVFRTLLREVAEDRPLGTVALAAGVDLLLVEALRCLVTPGAGRSRVPRHPAVARARTLLDEQYAAGWRMADLAAACGLSRTRLAELFTAEVGEPPYAYLLRRRVERAAELLAGTPYSVGEVAAEVGFSSPAQLARRFRRVYGRSPSQWRHRTGG